MGTAIDGHADDDEFAASSRDEVVPLDLEREERRKWQMQRPLGAKRSDVWNFFQIYTLERMSHLAICDTCGGEISRGDSKSTTPLKQHLKHKHPGLDLKGTAEKMEQEGAMEQFAVVNPDFPDSLLKWIIMTQQPLSASDNPYFKIMVHSLSRKTPVRNRKAVTQRLKELDQQVHKAMCRLVSGRFVACTTDAWTSVANEAFVALTLHWLTEAFELVTISLDCSTFSGSHTGDCRE
jgi:BED zinc finger